MKIQNTSSCDVLIAGAGPAGVCAAIAAARRGVRVILAEQGGFCGGMATRGLVGPFICSIRCGECEDCVAYIH